MSLLASARIWRLLEVVPVTRLAYSLALVLFMVMSRCTLEALQPPQKAMLSGVVRRGEDRAESQLIPDSPEMISMA